MRINHPTGDTSGWATIFGTVHGNVSKVTLTQECCKWCWFKDGISLQKTWLWRVDLSGNSSPPLSKVLLSIVSTNSSQLWSQNSKWTFWGAGTPAYNNDDDVLRQADHIHVTLVMGYRYDFSIELLVTLNLTGLMYKLNFFRGNVGTGKSVNTGFGVISGFNRPLGVLECVPCG